MVKTKEPVTIDGLSFDALITQGQSFSATVPEYPVEDGSVVSDSVIVSAPTLSMTLFLTDTPVTWKDKNGSYVGKARYDVERLKEIFFKKLPVTIITSEEIFENMAIESFSLSKSVELGTAKEIPLSFKQVYVTKSRTTTIPDSYGKGGQTATPSGTANTTVESSSSTSGNSSSSSETTEEQPTEKSSILYSAATSFGLL